MQERILQVFYGNDRLPYKDKDRTVHYPITGNTFLGSSNVDKIRFYVRDIGGTNSITWVLNAKLPNGSILYQVLSTIGLDAELNEYYVQFTLSQFYTQQKGDIYFSLNGCDGDVQIETDSETNIQTISATIESQTILTTGVIKFTNNYAPQRPVGFSFDIDQYQSIIDALSGKSNVVNTIQVVANITTEDLSGYDNGQLFYSLQQHAYYKKVESSPYYELADNGILASNKVVYRFGLVLTQTFQDVHDVVGNKLFVVSDFTNKEYLCYFEETPAIPTNKYTISALYLQDMALYQIVDADMGDNFTSLFVDTNKTLYVKQTTDNSKIYGTTGLGAQTTLTYGTTSTAGIIVQRDGNGQVNVPNTPTQNTHATSKYYVDTYFVPYSGATQDVDLGTHSLKTDKVEIGDQYHTIELVSGDLNIGTGSGDIYLQPYGKLYYGSNEVATYAQVVNAQTTLQTNIDKSGHSLAISGGIDTDFEYTITLKDKNSNTISTITFDLPLESVVVSGTYDSANQEIVLTLEDGSTFEIPVGDLVSGLVSQSDFNDLSATVTTNYNNSVKYADITITGGYVAQLQKNGVNYPVAQNVTTYTTPKVVATTNDLPSENDGYLYLVVADGYLYYWNGSAWVQGYEYATDLNQYVQTSRTIAGINLENDIGAQALTDALVFMNSTTDLDYVLED